MIYLVKKAELPDSSILTFFSGISTYYLYFSLEILHKKEYNSMLFMSTKLLSR